MRIHCVAVGPVIYERGVVEVAALRDHEREVERRAGDEVGRGRVTERPLGAVGRGEHDADRDGRAARGPGCTNENPNVRNPR